MGRFTREDKVCLLSLQPPLLTTLSYICIHMHSTFDVQLSETYWLYSGSVHLEISLVIRFVSYEGLNIPNG